MDWEQTVSLCIALVCVATLGVAATTLESTVSQSPSDLVDFDNAELPVGDDTTGDVSDQVAQNRGENDGSGQGSGDQGQQPSQPAADGQPEPASGEGGGQAQQDAAASASSGSGGPSLPSLLDRLLALLVALLPYLLGLALLGLAYRYRDRLLALVLAPFATAGGDHEGAMAAPEPWTDGPPSDPVDRAWYAMVERVGVDRPWAKTPRECAGAAIEAGLDAEAVGTLTDVFRETRYGGREATRAHRQLAVECADRLDLRGDAR